MPNNLYFYPSEKQDIPTTWTFSCCTSWWDVKSGGTHLCLKVHVKDSICFIHHQEFQSSQGEALCVLHVVYQAPRSRYRKKECNASHLCQKRQRRIMHLFQVQSKLECMGNTLLCLYGCVTKNKCIV